MEGKKGRCTRNMKGTDLKRKLGSYLPEHVQGVRSPVLETTMSIFKKILFARKRVQIPVIFPALGGHSFQPT